MVTIVHATDFSSASARAFAAALELARGKRGRLLLVHVMMPPSPFVGGRPPASWVELAQRARHAAERRLAAQIERAREAGVRAEGRLVEGAPADTILRVARRARAGLIVLGSHGRSGLGRLFMGSVARRVLSLASCPVLTVPAARRRGTA